MNRRTSPLVRLLCALGLALPLQAQAFSFGTFTPGDTIAELQLSAASGGGLIFSAGVAGTLSDGSLAISASVSSITMTV